MKVNTFLWLCFAAFCVSGSCSGRRAEYGVDSQGSFGSQQFSLVAVGEERVIVAGPNTLHLVRVRLQNESKEAVVGATPRLPCSCHIVDAPPKEIPPGGVFETAFKVLTPLRGLKEYKIEFIDSSKNLAGMATFLIDVAGKVPEVVRVPPSVQLVQVLGEQGLQKIELEAVEMVGSGPFVVSADFGNQAGIVAQTPHCTQSQPVDQNIVLQRYQIPVEVEATSIGDFDAMLQVRVAGGSEGAKIPVHVRVLARAHVSPCAIEFPATSVAGATATFHVISRVAGVEYYVSSVDRDLLTVEPDGQVESSWIVTCLRPASEEGETGITLTSTDGHEIMLPVVWK